MTVAEGPVITILYIFTVLYDRSADLGKAMQSLHMQAWASADLVFPCTIYECLSEKRPLRCGCRLLQSSCDAAGSKLFPAIRLVRWGLETRVPVGLTLDPYEVLSALPAVHLLHASAIGTAKSRVFVEASGHE